MYRVGKEEVSLVLRTEIIKLISNRQGPSKIANGLANQTVINLENGLINPNLIVSVLVF